MPYTVQHWADTGLSWQVGLSQWHFHQRQLWSYFWWCCEVYVLIVSTSLLVVYEYWVRLSQVCGLIRKADLARGEFNAGYFFCKHEIKYITLDMCIWIVSNNIILVYDCCLILHHYVLHVQIFVKIDLQGDWLLRNPCVHICAIYG